jgi:hypothetical protein
LNARAQRPRVRSFDEEVYVVPLHRKLGDAKARCPRPAQTPNRSA